MAEALQDLLGNGQSVDAATSDYISYLAGQPVDALRSSERQLLSQASNSTLLSIQGLSKKSYKAVVSSAESHASLRDTVPALSTNVLQLSRLISNLDSQVEHFSTSVSKASDNKLIAEAAGERRPPYGSHAGPYSAVVHGQYLAPGLLIYA
jgi:hypothetical protein